MEVLVENQSVVQVASAGLKELAEFVLSSQGETEGEVGIALVDTAVMHGLNKEYRGLDRPTDVLSFNLSDDDRELFGEVVIAPEVAAAQAVEAERTMIAELEMLVVHGLLHLSGLDHETDDGEREMFSRQEELLTSFYSERRAD